MLEGVRQYWRVFPSVGRCSPVLEDVPQCGRVCPVWDGVPKFVRVLHSVGECVTVREGVSQYEGVPHCRRVCSNVWRVCPTVGGWRVCPSVGGCAPV